MAVFLVLIFILLLSSNTLSWYKQIGAITLKQRQAENYSISGYNIQHSLVVQVLYMINENIFEIHVINPSYVENDSTILIDTLSVFRSVVINDDLLLETLSSPSYPSSPDPGFSPPSGWQRFPKASFQQSSSLFNHYSISLTIQSALYTFDVPLANPSHPNPDQIVISSVFSFNFDFFIFDTPLLVGISTISAILIIMVLTLLSLPLAKSYRNHTSMTPDQLDLAIRILPPLLLGIILSAVFDIFPHASYLYHYYPHINYYDFFSLLTSFIEFMSLIFLPILIEKLFRTYKYGETTISAPLSSILVYSSGLEELIDVDKITSLRYKLIHPGAVYSKIQRSRKNQQDIKEDLYPSYQPVDAKSILSIYQAKFFRQHLNWYTLSLVIFLLVIFLPQWYGYLVMLVIYYMWLALRRIPVKHIRILKPKEGLD